METWPLLFLTREIHSPYYEKKLYRTEGSDYMVMIGIGLIIIGVVLVLIGSTKK